MFPIHATHWLIGNPCHVTPPLIGPFFGLVRHGTYCLSVGLHLGRSVLAQRFLAGDQGAGMGFLGLGQRCREVAGGRSGRGVARRRLGSLEGCLGAREFRGIEALGQLLRLGITATYSFFRVDFFLENL